jgi:hypothetical protein
MFFMGLNTVTSLAGFAGTLTFSVQHYQTALNTNSGKCYSDFKDVFIYLFIVESINGLLCFLTAASTFTLYLQLFTVNPAKYFSYKDEPDIKIRM